VTSLPRGQVSEPTTGGHELARDAIARQLVADGRKHRVGSRCVGDHKPGAAVADEVGILVASIDQIDRYRDDARADGAEKDRRNAGPSSSTRSTRSPRCTLSERSAAPEIRRKSCE